MFPLPNLARKELSSDHQYSLECWCCDGLQSNKNNPFQLNDIDYAQPSYESDTDFHHPNVINRLLANCVESPY